MVHRAALIGCGWIGSEFRNDSVGIASHAAAYTACADTKLVAVCDVDDLKANRAGERWNVSACYDDAARMLAEARADIVSICTPDATHYATARLALETPGVRAVLVEKPLALELPQAAELASLARARGIALAVNYTRRYLPEYAELRERICNGELGRIVAVAGLYSKGTIHNGTHWFDLARFFFGEVRCVRGFDLLGEATPDATLDAILEFGNGASGHLQAFDATAGALFEMDILGSAGRLRLCEPGPGVETYLLGESRTFPEFRVFERISASEMQNRDGLLHAVEDLVRCVQRGGVPKSAAEDGLAALRIALAVRESAQIGQPVVLPIDHV